VCVWRYYIASYQMWLPRLIIVNRVVVWCSESTGTCYSQPWDCGTGQLSPSAPLNIHSSCNCADVWSTFCYVTWIAVLTSVLWLDDNIVLCWRPVKFSFTQSLISCLKDLRMRMFTLGPETGDCVCVLQSDTWKPLYKFVWCTAAAHHSYQSPWNTRRALQYIEGLSTDFY